MKRSAGLLLATLSLATFTRAADVSEKMDKLVTALHEANARQIELGQLAYKKGKNAAVRGYGQHMMLTYKENDAKLLKVVEQEKLTIFPKTAQTDEDREKLNKKSGLDFDLAYIDLMIHRHNAWLGELKDAQGWLPPGEVRKMADETVPLINQYVSIAKQIRIDLEAMKP